jgi:hypothetical protein
MFAKQDSAMRRIQPETIEELSSPLTTTHTTDPEDRFRMTARGRRTL